MRIVGVGVTVGGGLTRCSLLGSGVHLLSSSEWSGEYRGEDWGSIGWVQLHRRSQRL